MDCERCGVEMVERKATVGGPYKYDLAGGFLLSGILVYRCPRCGDEAPLIPRITQLHRLMAKILVEKPSALSGPEIRFLRKHAGFSAQEFAALLGVDASHLSRVETSKPGFEKLGKPADRLARLVGTNGKESARDSLRKLAAAELRRDRARRLKRAFQLVDGKGWREAA
jgi:DNA-binding transcriptional regulator YiaG